MKNIFLLLLIPVFIGFFWFITPPEITYEPPWIFYDQRGEVLFSEKQYFAPLEEVQAGNVAIQQILIVLEDKKFYDHGGVDFLSLIRAALQNIKKDRIVSGASTITMQLARLLYLQEESRDYGYKIRQIFHALRLDAHLSKDEILDLYLQKIYFGQGAVGVHSAAKRYFNKSVSALNLGEKATLVGIVPRPDSWNPITHFEKSQERKRLVLDRLFERGLITEEEKNFHSQTDVLLRPLTNYEIHAPHFVLWAQEKILSKLCPSEQEETKGKSFEKKCSIKGNPSEIHVHTTINKEKYQQVLPIVRQNIEKRSETKNLSNGSVIVLKLPENTLEVMLGSQDFFAEDIQGAVNMSTASRELGSTLKPFLFALALEKGHSPLEELRDERQSFAESKGNYSPRNFDPRREYGRVRYREALSNSYNISSVELLTKLGIGNFYDFLGKWGMDMHTSPTQTGLAVILGSGESSLLDLTTGYSVFANGGRFDDVAFYTKVEDQKGRILLSAPPQSFKQIIRLSTAEWITHVLSDRESRWRMFGRGNPLELPFPVAAKTGTSQDFRDNYVLGYSTDYVTGVWTGNADGTPMHTSSGMEGAGPIWQAVMQAVHEVPPDAFSYKTQRQEKQVCRRPYEMWPDCVESYTAFLLPEERTQTQTPSSLVPQLQISFPGDGDIFHKNSDILIQTRYAPEEKVRYFVNGKETGAILSDLPSGRYTLRVESGGEVNEIQITISD